MYFEEVSSEVQQSRRSFSENVRDSFGSSVCEELYDRLNGDLEAADRISSAADIREGIIKTLLTELRVIL